MGTSISITLYDTDDEEILSGAFDIISDIERKISINSENSYISKVNASSGKESVVLSDDVYSLVEYAMEIGERTGYLFNPAIGALTKLWNIGSGDERVPSREEIDRALELVSPEDVILNDDEKSVFLRKEGMKLDLGGIGKGYAADRVRDYLISKGVRRAILNLGGNIYAMGEKDEETPWTVGILSPIDESGILTTVKVVSKSVVTSGAYERYFIEDGVRYHHIIDSKTGYPSDSDLVSSSIVSESSTLADALSTAVFIGGIESAEELSESFGVEIILADKDGRPIFIGEEYNSQN